MSEEIKKYKLPCFIHLYKNNEVLAIYNSITLDILYVSPEFEPLLEKFRNNEIALDLSNENDLNKHSEFFHELIEKKILIESELEESQMIRSIAENEISDDLTFNVLKVFITHKCNFECKYCLIENNLGWDIPKIDMTIDTAKKSVDLFINNSKNVKGLKTIMLYGGEPLLNLDVVKDIILYIREKEKQTENQPFEIILETNASLITDGIAQFIAQNDIVAQVSIDGPKDIHDQMRVYDSGKGTFNDVEKGLSILRYHNCKAIVSSVLGKHNVYNTKEIVSFFSDDLKVPSIGLDLLHVLEEDKCNPADAPIDDICNSFVNAYKESRIKGLYVEHVIRRVRPFVFKKRRIKDCPACGSKMVISASGDIGLCEGFVGSGYYCDGNVKEKTDVSNGIPFKEWNKRTPFLIEECFDCPAISICGGGCPYNSYTKYGDLNKFDDKTCATSKFILEWLIWDLFDIVGKEHITEIKEGKIFEPTLNDRKKIFGNIPEVPNVPLQSVSKKGEIDG